MSGSRSPGGGGVSKVAQSGDGGSIRVNIDSDNVAVITMDRGENRINDQFIDQMNSAIDKVLRNGSVRALVLTGTGKYFSLGMDVPWVKELDKIPPDYGEKFGDRWHSLILRLLTLPLPTVAAINGHVYAGGGVISLCLDYRVMRADRGWWRLNEGLLGLRLHPIVVALCKLKFAGNGLRSFVDANLFARQFTAEQAKNAGIINEMCSSDQLLTSVREILNTVLPDNGQIERSFVGDTKRQVYCEVVKAASDPLHAKLAKMFAAKL